VNLPKLYIKKDNKIEKLGEKNEKI
jgi:hypothetical protein